jgi:histidinol-phosphate/aromatic aminotransferase/cobyric acid decarboxylase-like protein/SAM-dependent methyltransferase
LNGVAGPWYRDYFSPDFWRLLEQEYTAERTANEVEYLAGVLRTRAPGNRVMDLGCGTGRHCVPLARLGYRVTGLDVSAWALGRARDAAVGAGAEVELRKLDLLTDSWRCLPRVDAIISIQSFGWGDDPDQLEFLGRAADHLVPGGVLVLDHSNLAAILGDYAAEAEVVIGADTFRFSRTFDPGTGRSRGSLQVIGADGQTVTQDDVRLYLPCDVRRLLGSAGFVVERVDADFRPGADPSRTTRYVQFLARRGPAPSPPLRAARSGAGLDLRWAPDEVDFVREALDAAWAEVIGGDDRLVDRARRYAVDDPWRGGRGAEVLSGHFGCPISPSRIVFGAGATGLLRDLATLARGRPVVHHPYAHAELPGEARRLGVSLHPFDGVGAPGRVVRLLEDQRPGAMLLERPDVLGEIVDLDDLRRTLDLAASRGVIVILDETCATYLGPEQSAVPLTLGSSNLVVVRSMSKGYCCGGLRVGFAVCSPPLEEAVRAACAPLAVSEVALEVSLRLLAQGDLLRGLRAHLALVKPGVVTGLRAAGLEVLPGDPQLPWVVVRADNRARSFFTARGISAKPLTDPWEGRREELLRVSVPLSPDRLGTFRSLVAEGR